MLAREILIQRKKKKNCILYLLYFQTCTFIPNSSRYSFTKSISISRIIHFLSKIPVQFQFRTEDNPFHVALSNHRVAMHVVYLTATTIVIFVFYVLTDEGEENKIGINFFTRIRVTLKPIDSTMNTKKGLRGGRKEERGKWRNPFDRHFHVLDFDSSMSASEIFLHSILRTPSFHPLV